MLAPCTFFFFFFKPQILQPLFIIKVILDPHDGLISRISGSEHRHQDLQTFWIHSDEDQLPAGSSHTGWGCLWSPSWKPHPCISGNRPPGLWWGTGRLCKSGPCDHHPSLRLRCPPQKITPCPEAEEPSVAYIAVCMAWSSPGVPFTLMRPLLHLQCAMAMAVFCLHLNICTNCRGPLDHRAAGVDKSSSPHNAVTRKVLHVHIFCLHTFYPALALQLCLMSPRLQERIQLLRLRGSQEAWCKNHWATSEETWFPDLQMPQTSCVPLRKTPRSGDSLTKSTS